MTVHEDQDLRERLDALLDSIEPRPAPVALAMRQGNGIRRRRWVTAVAGLAVVAGGAAALPVVLGAGRSAPLPAATLRYSVTVHGPGRNAPAGLIAYGTQDGKRWQVAMSGRGANEQLDGAGLSFDGPPPAVVQPGPVTVESGTNGATGNTTIVGAVTGDVTAVTVALPGKVLRLRPVRYLGERYIAIVLPADVPVLRTAAYDGSRELAYSVPYERGDLANWWRPGQAGPARFTKTILGGVADGRAWQLAAHYGPWGYCFTLPNSTACPQRLRVPAGELDQSVSCGGLATGDSSTPDLGLAVVRADVRQVTIRLSGGAVERYTPVATPGGYVLGYVIPKGHTIAKATALSAAGRVLGPLTSLSCAA
jgi:hypothetical protein